MPRVRAREAPVRRRGWFVTGNSENEAALDKMAEIAWETGKFSWLYGQKERGGKKKRVHVHVVVRCKESMSMLAVKRCFGDVQPDVEVRRGTEEQCVGYMENKPEEMKMGEPWEFGERAKPGERKDVKMMVEMAKSGTKWEDAIDEVPSAVRYMRAYDRILAGVVPEMVWEETILVIGPPGCGKTRLVREETRGKGQELYVVMQSGHGKWFDGYRGQENVLFDDFAGACSKMELTLWLCLIDRYEMEVEVKGGTVWLNSRVKWVTSMFNPYSWYKWEGRGEQREAIKRRFTKVIEFVLCDDGYRKMVVEDELTKSVWWKKKLEEYEREKLECEEKVRMEREGMNWYPQK